MKKNLIHCFGTDTESQASTLILKYECKSTLSCNELLLYESSALWSILASFRLFVLVLQHTAFSFSGSVSLIVFPVTADGFFQL